MIQNRACFQNSFYSKRWERSSNLDFCFVISNEGGNSYRPTSQQYHPKFLRSQHCPIMTKELLFIRVIVIQFLENLAKMTEKMHPAHRTPHPSNTNKYSSLQTFHCFTCVLPSAQFRESCNNYKEAQKIADKLMQTLDTKQ